MARQFAESFGTEEDHVHCSFFFKIGSCRHGERCARKHARPKFSQTILLKHFYDPAPNTELPPKEARRAEEKHFESFFDEVFDELRKFGEIEELNVCDNLGDHLYGNTYVKYQNEEDAEKAISSLNGRFYNGRNIQAEYSPVTNFRDGRCRQYDEGRCTRGGYCNFLHLKVIPRNMRRYLKKPPFYDRRSYYRWRDDERRRKHRRRGRSRSRDRRDGRRSRRERSRSKEGRSDTHLPEFDFFRETSRERRIRIKHWNESRDKRMRKEGKDPDVPEIKLTDQYNMPLAYAQSANLQGGGYGSAGEVLQFLKKPQPEKLEGGPIPSGPVPVGQPQPNPIASGPIPNNPNMYQ